MWFSTSRDRNFDSSEFDSTGVKLYIFIHNEVRDFDKNSTQPSSRQRESTVYNFVHTTLFWHNLDLHQVHSKVKTM
jgi:hypothetical protein